MTLLDTLIADMAFAVSQLYDLLKNIGENVDDLSDHKRVCQMDKILMVVTDYYFLCSIVPPLDSLETSCDIDICKVLRSLSLKLPELELCFKETYLGMDCIFKCGLSQQVVRAIFMGLCAWRVTFDAKVYKNIFTKYERGPLTDLFSSLRFNLCKASSVRVPVPCVDYQYLVSDGFFVCSFYPPFSRKISRYIQVIDSYLKDYGKIDVIPTYSIDQKINTSYLRGDTKLVRRAVIHNLFVKCYRRHVKGDPLIKVAVILSGTCLPVSTSTNVRSVPTFQWVNE